MRGGRDILLQMLSKNCIVCLVHFTANCIECVNLQEITSNPLPFEITKFGGKVERGLWYPRVGEVWCIEMRPCWLKSDEGGSRYFTSNVAKKLHCMHRPTANHVEPASL